MPEIYRHTQTGKALRLTLLAAPLIWLPIAYSAGQLSTFPPLVMALFAVLGLALGYCFSSLTVVITEIDVRWYFGPGVWRKSLMLREISNATAERNKWWWGWGIHRTPRGWLYNVAGLDAVEIIKHDGAMLRIGSDEADVLARVIMSMAGRPNA